MQLKIIDPAEDKRWDGFISDFDHSSIYHHSLWKELVEKTYGYEPSYFILEDDSKNIRGAAPLFLVRSWLTGNRLVGLPFADYCDPLFSDEWEFELLLNGVLELAGKLKVSYIEWKTRNGLCDVQGCHFERTDYYKGHVLELLGTLEEVEEKFHKSFVRRNIDKALKSKLLMMEGEDETDMRIFYDLYVSTRKEHGLPAQPYKFFRNLWNLLRPDGMLHLLLAFDGSTPLAGIIILIFKNTMYYLYGGSKKNFLTKRPNHLLLWKAIQMGHEKGLRYFDFGRTSVRNQSLMDFKRRWGALEYDIPYYYWSERNRSPVMLNVRGKNLVRLEKIIQKLPPSVLTRGGEILYKHFG